MSRTAYLDHPGPIPLAHRGYSRAGLENTMTAFQAAVDLGFRYVETDVHATTDERVVAFHDETLDRVTDRTGRITELSWREVALARVGAERVPLLEDVLGTWPELRVNIDIKTASAVSPLVRAIERTRAHDRVCVTSFSDVRRRGALMRLSRPVVTSAGQVTAALFRGAATLPRGTRAVAVRRALAGVDGVQVPVRFRGVPVVTAASVAATHAAGRFVHVWTVNERTEMHRLLDLGVDGLVSDRADLLREVLLERGQWP